MSTKSLWIVKGKIANLAGVCRMLSIAALGKIESDEVANELGV